MNRKAIIRSSILWILVLTWATVIFLFSAQDAATSSALSDKVTTFLLQLFGIDSPTMFPTPDTGGWFLSVRTMAHFASFAIFGMLTALAIRSHRTGRWQNWLFPAGISLFYAIFDEIHQAFVPGRSTEWQDIAVDFGGAILGIALIATIYTIIQRRNAKRTAGV